jgi:hypothetical protein
MPFINDTRPKGFSTTVFRRRKPAGRGADETMSKQRRAHVERACTKPSPAMNRLKEKHE